MDISRTMQTKPRAIRKLNDYHSCDEIDKEDTVEMTKFKFPPPPQIPLEHSLSYSPRQSNSDVDTTSDSQSDTGDRGMSSPIRIRNTVYAFRGYQSEGSPVTTLPKCLPPIGVFWDIENCQIPRGRSAVTVVQAIRDKFFDGYREEEFIVVCDVKKETAQVIQELNDAQVNLIHVGSTCKNAADEKLRQSVRRFADLHCSPAAVILITGDINFAPDICDLRHRKKIHVILLHNDICSESLILCANENHSFSSLVSSLPYRGNMKTGNQPAEVFVNNLPAGQDPARIRHRLKRLAENCGGKVGFIIDLTTTIKFPTFEGALRARKRMNGEKVFGSQINVSYPSRIGERKDIVPMKPNQNRKLPVKMSECDSLNYSPMLQYLGNTQPTTLPHRSTPPAAVNIWQSSQSFHGDSTGRMPVPGIYCTGHTIGLNQSNPVSSQNIYNQENIGQIPVQQQQLVWDADRGWIKTNQNLLPRGRPILGARNDNDRASDSQRQSSVEVNQISEWTHNSADKNCDHQVGSNIVKRSRPSSPMTAAPHVHSRRSEGNRQQLNQNCSIPPRKCRTPSPYTLVGVNTSIPPPPALPTISVNTSIPPPPIVNLPRRLSQENKDTSEKYFQPIQSSPCNPVELHVTNLDQTIEPMEIKKILMAVFREHVMVLHVSVFVQSDANLAASVKVPSLQDAQYAISQLHRRKIGHKRIIISYAHSGSPHNPQYIRSQIVSLLLEVPGHRLPLFKFCELFENRYLTSVSVSDLNRMRDVCIITKEPSGRTISLNPDHRNTPSPLLPSVNPENGQPEIDVPFCRIHIRNQFNKGEKGWAEQEVPSLPNIRVRLSVFGRHLLSLVQSHNNFLPLASLVDCYEAECGTLTIDESGVPLEHLVTCISAVELAVGNACTFAMKYLHAADGKPVQEEKSDEIIMKSVSPSLANQLSLFGREIVDLLKTQPHCQLMFNRFIPAYHHHFGRQCRVADYGFIKLIDLLESLPHIVQVYGEGDKRMITLSHRSQVRRFTSDLLRVLKSQASRQLMVSEIGTLYERTFSRTFDPVDYGLCYLEDLLAQLSENIVVISGEGPSAVIAIPKREQTPEEIERTKQFALAVVELLSHTPQCSMLFNKFIPAYHHQFGHQCRVADFGFSKLIELFEAIPHVVKIDEDSEGERRVTLTNEEKLKVLSNHMAELVQSRYPPGLPVNEVSSAFLWQYGHALKPETYGCDNLQDLIEKLHSTVKVVNLDCGPTLIPVDQARIQQLSLCVRRVLMSKGNAKMTYEEFDSIFQKLYDHKCTLETMEKYLHDTVKTSHDKDGTTTVQLTSLQLFARDVYRLLSATDSGRLALNSFEAAYLRTLGTAVQPAQYGFQSVVALLQAIPHTISIRGKGPKRVVILNKELESAGIMLPPGLTKTSPHTERPMNGDRNQNTSAQYNWNKSPSQQALLQGLSCSETKDTQDFNSDGTPGVSDSSDNWNTVWNNGNSIYSNEEVPVVQLPELCTPPGPDQCATLLSPCKSLMHVTPLSRLPVPLIVPPDPSELPLPRLYLTSPPQETQNGEDTEEIDEEGSAEESTTLGVDVLRDSETSCSSSDAGTPSGQKRKTRLAAQFHTPMQ